MARVLPEMETLTVTLDNEGSRQYGTSEEWFLREYEIQKHGIAKGCVRNEGSSG